MKTFLKRTAAAAVVAFPLSAAFTAQANAEDTGLVNYLNAQTRAQVEAYKQSLQQKGKSANPSGMGAGVRG